MLRIKVKINENSYSITTLNSHAENANNASQLQYQSLEFEILLTNLPS